MGERQQGTGERREETMGHPGIGESTLLVITNDGMGQGPRELQRKLLHNYLRLLDENGMRPGAICFYTSAVKLAAEDSDILGVLKSLESRGVHLILCKTCLDFFDLADQTHVGIVGGMPDIIAAMAAAEKVITL
jgi:hypothetical protein